MKLSENPIFLTHKRLVHRGGVLAAIIIATLIGLSLLLGLFSVLADNARMGWRSPQESGRAFYGWVVGVEIVVLVMGGFARVCRALQEDRKAGLWDSNRLTPMRARDIVLGYWLAPGLREAYMAAVLAVFGLLIVLFSGLPVTLWLGTQTLIVSTALFCGLLGMLLGMALQKSSGALIFLVFFFLYPTAFIAPAKMLTNFLFPIYGVVNFFTTSGNGGVRDWSRVPEFFGVPVPALLLSVALQALIGWFVWRVLVRKTANPFQPLLLRWEALAIFSILVGVQHGLIWGGWKDARQEETGMLMALTHGGTLLAGLALLILAGRPPEQLRVEAMRLGLTRAGQMFSRSGVSLALPLALVGALLLVVQFTSRPQVAFENTVVAAVNQLAIFVLVALLLDYCRLRHQRRALGFVALWAFVLVGVPLILGAIFGSAEVAQVSLLAPGFAALSDNADALSLRLFHCINLAHLMLAALFYLNWHRQWQQRLSRST